MRLSNGFLLSTLCAIAVAGCGGSASDTADASSAAKGGNPKPVTTSQVSIAVAPAPVDRNAPMTISLYPGSFMDDSLFIKFVCYQNGYMDDVDGSYELHAASSQGFPGYTFDGDHFSWTFVLSEGMNYGLQAGPADCNVTGWYVNKRQQWYQIASATFSVL